MDRKELAYNIYADVYRSFGNVNKLILLKVILGYDIKKGSHFTLYMRVCNYLYRKNNKLSNKILFKIFYNKLIRLQVKYGIQISCTNEIGEGVSIPHFGGIVIAGDTRIGKNCTILQNVTIGSNLFKDRYCSAVIGDNVFIGAGAKIIGPVKISNNVTIGANSVITKDVPEGCVVAGNPARIISNKGSIVINNDYLSYDEFKII